MISEIRNPHKAYDGIKLCFLYFLPHFMYLAYLFFESRSLACIAALFYSFFSVKFFFLFHFLWKIQTVKSMLTFSSWYKNLGQERELFIAMVTCGTFNNLSTSLKIYIKPLRVKNGYMSYRGCRFIAINGHDESWTLHFITVSWSFLVLKFQHSLEMLKKRKQVIRHSLCCINSKFKVHGIAIYLFINCLDG